MYTLLYPVWTQIVSISWLLHIMLWQIRGCWYLFKIVVLFLSGKYPKVGLLDHMTVLFLIFLVTSILFSTLATPIYIRMSDLFPITASLLSSYPFQNPAWIAFLFCLHTHHCQSPCQGHTHAMWQETESLAPKVRVLFLPVFPEKPLLWLRGRD